MKANPRALLGEPGGGWANFWPSDRGSAMTRATLSHGPLDQTLDSLALFRYKRFPLSIELSTLPQKFTRKLTHKILDGFANNDCQPTFNAVKDGKLLPLVVLHPLIRDRAGLF